MRTAINRREFLCSAALILAAPASSVAFGLSDDNKGDISGSDDIRGKIFKGDAPDKPWKWSHEGFLYTKSSDRKVVCGICPHRCVLSPGDRSVCRSKVNIDGVLYSLAYGNPCSVNIDPIEKKPLFHFKPQTKSFSLAVAGCNFRCLNCQNWEISQAKPGEVRQSELFPEDVIKAALKSGSESISCTYSEPVSYFEYMIDIARLAKENGLSSLWISNGYINREPLTELCRYINGANVNLKSFSDNVYRKLNGGRLEPVLNTFKTLNDRGIHFEMTNLVVPGYVDDPEMVKRMCGWILANLGPDHPLHFLRFFPQYKLDRLPPTPVSTLENFRSLAMKEGIRYAYVGNVPNHEGMNTYCHNCKKLLIERKGYLVPAYNLSGNRCKFCNTVIPGVWEKRGG
ncbi:MAG: AmmeMemoRadiSam system radical SAM enzyme [Desulfobacteraceae bacterium]|nr:MAG: AmmeMemoRadiSam system radical SAM enzyme [Desulfobacteraceae bacterium]